jgi:hypothetical protein
MEAVFFIVGAALVILSIRNAVKGSATRNWQRTSGRMLRSFVLVANTDEGEAHTATVEYEYTVAGAVFKGTRLRFGQTGSWNRAHAEHLLAPYPAESSVDVFFDPRNPADAVLRRGVSWGNVLIFLAGMAFVGFAWGIQLHI